MQPLTFGIQLNFKISTSDGEDIDYISGRKCLWAQVVLGGLARFLALHHASMSQRSSRKGHKFVGSMTVKENMTVIMGVGGTDGEDLTSYPHMIVYLSGAVCFKLKALLQNGQNCYMHVEGYKVNMCACYRGKAQASSKCCDDLSPEGSYTLPLKTSLFY